MDVVRRVAWISLALSGYVQTASADDAPPTNDETATSADDGQAEEVPPAPPDADGSRRRRGTALLFGMESVHDTFDNKLSAPMGGLDTRFGIQINDRIGVYVPLHLSFGAFSGLGTVAGVPAGLTGTAAATVVADVTFVDRVFVGAGAGVGILNNPIGPAIHLRAGGYPVMSRMADSHRRKGLGVAADLRIIYATGITATFPTLSVSYESF